MVRETIEIEGGYRIEGEVRLSGAKNAALPLLAAACMGEEPTTLTNVPVKLNDVKIMIELLSRMGAQIHIRGDEVTCARGTLAGGDVPSDLANRVRSSLLLLGLSAAFQGQMFLPQPGGCDIGDRKYDLHLMGLRALGAEIDESPEGIALKSTGLKGTKIDFYLPTTSGTENIMLAAAMARGETVIRNANTRPEIVQLGQLLSAMGASVKTQSRIVAMEGVERLRGGVRFTVMPGWDEAVTYMIAAGMTEGEIAILDFNLSPIREEARYLREAGLHLFEWRGSLYVSGKHQKQPFDLFTAPYPGVNSDMQPLFAALALAIPGVSTITDLRFTDRFRYVEELKRFGADIQSFGNTAIVRGGMPLHGTTASATDLRGGMACVLCGLVAEGETRITNVYQIGRGYEDFCAKLTALGARVYEV